MAGCHFGGGCDCQTIDSAYRRAFGGFRGNGYPNALHHHLGNRGHRDHRGGVRFAELHCGIPQTAGVMMRESIIFVASLGLAACTQISGPGGGDTYQKYLGLLCSAPPNVMAPVLTTPQLQQAWEFICAHVGSVPATPVASTRIAIIAEE